MHRRLECQRGEAGWVNVRQAKSRMSNQDVAAALLAEVAGAHFGPLESTDKLRSLRDPYVVLLPQDVGTDGCARMRSAGAAMAVARLERCGAAVAGDRAAETGPCMRLLHGAPACLCAILPSKPGLENVRRPGHFGAPAGSRHQIRVPCPQPATAPLLAQDGQRKTGAAYRRAAGRRDGDLDEITQVGPVAK